MFTAEREMAARLAAFAWLDSKMATGQSELTREELEGFTFEGERLKLLDQSRGIRNPANFSATLSVMTTIGGPYADEPVAGGFVRYEYQDGGEGGTNVKLRRAAELRAPVIYFRSIRRKVFIADYPAYVTDLPGQQAVLLTIGEDLHSFGDPDAMNEAQRSYAERVTRQRLHQPLFRAKVMYAYESRCAVCSLRHADLLDAAHIIPDRDDAGAPEVRNGVALCKIHHAAYDRNFLGLSPDYVIHINQELMLEVDGPMLRYGIQAMDKQALQVPRRTSERPDREKLAHRFEEFARSA